MSTTDLQTKGSTNTLNEAENGRKDPVILEESRVRNLSQRIRRLLPTSSSSRASSVYESTKEDNEATPSQGQGNALDESWIDLPDSNKTSSTLKPSPSLAVNSQSNLSNFNLGSSENLNAKINEGSTELKLEDLHWLTNNENQPKSTRDLINGTSLPAPSDNDKSVSNSDSDTDPQSPSIPVSEKKPKPYNPLADLQMDPVQKKRNIDFHINFPSLPLDDILIEDWHCALQKDILVTGRMYITQERICFHSNLFGWVNHTIINFKDIVSLQKRSTAFVIPNAIQIITLDQKYFFTSFMSRDSAFTLLYEHWFKKCPNRATDPNKSIPTSNECKDEKCDLESTGSGITTLCKCLQSSTSHEGTLNLDTTFPTSIQTLYGLLYGEDTTFILNHLKSANLEVVVGGWKEDRSRDVTYIKPLTNPLGPKQTHCNIVETIIYDDLDNYCTVEARIQTPDVPSGDAFTVITKTCLMRYRTDQSRLVMTTTLEWSKSSWFKGPIEAGSRAGATQSAKELDTDIHKYLDDHPDLVTKPQGEDDTSDVTSIKLDLNSELDQPTNSAEGSIRSQLTFRNCMLVVLGTLAILNLINWWWVLHLQHQIHTHKAQLKKNLENVKVNPLTLPQNQPKVLKLKQNLESLSDHLLQIENNLNALRSTKDTQFVGKVETITDKQ